eukprot:jgi/Psemu1/58064/gm1.58064_g
MMLAPVTYSFVAFLAFLGHRQYLSKVDGFQPRTTNGRFSQQQQRTTTVVRFPENPAQKPKQAGGTRTGVVHVRIHVHVHVHRAAPDGSGDGESADAHLAAEASKKLPWELSDEKQQKPVLNLSLRDASPEDLPSESEDDVAANKWNKGQRWEATIGFLEEMGIVADDDDDDETTPDTPWLSPARKSSALLRDCPQLFRLEPSEIRKTGEWIAETFGTGYLSNAVLRDRNAVLLSFRRDDAEYGLEFMSLMMMTDAKPACLASSAFLVTAIEGGIQERAVGAALGLAAEATSRASKSIASDTMESFRQLRDAKRHKK